jgi:hypothetical protein
MSQLIRRRIEIDPLMFSTANVRRTPGLHLTDVVRDMLTLSGVMKVHKSEAQGGYSADDLGRYQLQGYVWEDVFTEIVAKRLTGCTGSVYMRLPEIAFNPRTGRAFWVQYDDKTGELLTPVPCGFYICSPDGGRLEAHRFSLAEFKWTTKSAKMDPEKDKPEWFYQVRGYLGALSAAAEQEITRVEWHVQFPVGEFWGCPPVYEEWEREYSPGEVADTWAAVSAHAQWRVASVEEHPWRQWL